MRINDKKIDWDAEYEKLAEKIDEQRHPLGLAASVFLLCLGCGLGVFWSWIARLFW